MRGTRHFVTSLILREIGKGDGDRNDNYSDKACYLNALQPSTPASRNKVEQGRKLVRMRSRETYVLYSVYALKLPSDWIRLLGTSILAGRFEYISLTIGRHI